MMALVFACAFALAFTLFITLQKRERAQREAGAISQAQQHAWEEATAQSDGIIQRYILAASRPISIIPQVDELGQGPLGRIVHRRLLASGGLFGNSIEIFFSVQIFAFVVAALAVLAGLSTDDRLAKFGALLLAFGLAAYPWNKVTSKAKARARAITRSLPAFAKLVQMPLTSGAGSVIQALAFTAERTEGPVADVVNEMLRAVGTKQLSVAEGLTQAGERLGTPSAKAFFAALLQSDNEGARITENLEAQAKALAKTAHEDRRAEILQLPERFPGIFILHFIPLLLVVIFVPVLAQLAGNLG